MASIIIEGRRRPPMTRTIYLAALLAAVMMGSASPVIGRGAQEAKDHDEVERVSAAVAVMNEIMGADDKAIPRSILGKAEGIAVFPSTFKGGFVVGATHGRGILSVRGQDGKWSAPAFLTITGGSFGAQIGGQATDLVLVIMNRRGLENLVRNQFKVGADASAAAGPVGREAQASTDIQMRAQILSYSRSRGLFAGATVNGTTFKMDKDANTRFYGKPLETKQIVFENAATDREPIPAWKATLVKYAN
jgi:SH3 domain-containing YSC84-like protein 1